MGECRVHRIKKVYRDKSLLLTIQEQCLRNQRKAQAGKEFIALEQTTFRLNLSLLTQYLQTPISPSVISSLS
jgi:hypothetical protein